MESPAPETASALATSVFGRQQCPECAHTLVAPDASQYVSEHVIKHQWSCECCGTEFTTTVSLRRRQSCRSVAGA